jgi:hypothetical protein
MRPQELALYGEKVHFGLRYSPIADRPDELAERHFKLLVLEVHAELPSADALAHGKPRRLQLLKCGWEAELATTVPARVDQLAELDEEVPRLLGRIADTVNELARRAGLEAPLGPDLVRDLVVSYRSNARGGANDSQQVPTE